MLKVYFMKECHKHPEEWADEILADRALSILAQIEADGKKDELTSYYVKNDPLFPGDSDHSHVEEARRMLHHLDSVTQMYHTHGLVHILVWLLFALCQVGLGIASFFSWSGADMKTDDTSPDTITIDKSAVVFLPAVHLAVATLAFWLPIFGGVWIWSSPPSVIYKIYRGLFIIYGIMFLSGTTQLMTSIFLSHFKGDIFRDDSNFSITDSILVITSTTNHACAGMMGKEDFLGKFRVCCWLSGLTATGFPLLLFIHIAWITILGKHGFRRSFRQPNHGQQSSKYHYYHCELVFCDEVYSNIRYMTDMIQPRVSNGYTVHDRHDTAACI